MFSDDANFDEIEWINSLFKGVSDKEVNFHCHEVILYFLIYLCPIQKAIEDAVSKLQLYVQQSNLAIESTTHDIISSMPLIISESKNLKTQAIALKERMNDLEKDISKTETAFSMANLERLDNLKTKLEGAKNFLEQNDSFSKLTQELDDLLESERKDISLACEKLFALQKSFEAQMGLAGQGERELVLEDFKNRLEASITGDVVKALSDSNAEESIKYVQMFKKIDRLAQMKNYYGTLQKDNFIRNWIEVAASVENSDNPRFLNDFYDFLLSSWGKQLKWYRDVFSSDGVTETIKVISETLVALHPSRESVIGSYLKRINEKMELLLEVSISNVKFANAIREKINEYDKEIPSEKMLQLSSAIFDFFNIFIVQYSSIEQNALNTQFDGTKIMQTSSSETIRCLENSLSKIFDWVNEAIDRESAITQDCAIVSLIYILNTFFKGYLEKFKKAQLQLDASRTDHQDWNLLQICIALLQNIGVFKTKLDDIEEKIKKIMLAKSKHIKDGEMFCYKIVGQRDINDFQKIVNRLMANESIVIFESLMTPVSAICKDVHQLLLFNVFTPIENYFKKLEINNSMSADLPDYSYTPMEYITEIGQFLLTLPQHLEPLLLNPSSTLKIALEMSEANYKESIPSADILLGLVVDETCALYQEKILQIMEISDGAAKQLATDIDYFTSVLEELGLTISSQLKQMAHLLKAKSESYMSVSTGIDARLVAAIRQMRSINISSDS